MVMSSGSQTKGVFGTRVFRALLGEISPGRLNWRLARFADKDLERIYQRHLVENELPKDRLINYACIFVYVVFGVLDVMTFTDRLPDVLALRLGICAPLALGLIMLTHAESVKPYFQYITALVILLGSGSIVLMIGWMGPDQGTVYIIGILTVFIAYSCLQRLYFPVAASIYLTIFSLYSATVIFFAPKVGSEIAAGHFFMITITLVSLLTSYVQEVRSRLDFFRGRQREQDAAYIEELLIEATAADSAKNGFLSILSHEMKTPLHQIIGFSEVARNELAQTADHTTLDHVNEIHESATALLKTIAKMLRYADATAGKTKYEPERIQVGMLIETVIDQTRTSANERSVQVVSKDLEAADVMVDHPHTSYAIAHLVENAVAASRSGGTVTISGRLEAASYVLVVSDEGCGMDERQLEAAQMPFTQSENHKTRKREGVGIGLTLSRKLLEDQHAELSITSELGAGTRVEVRLPLPRQREEAAPASSA